MSVTVKVIFVGLIGFVPSPEGQNDMAALLVNPTEAEEGYEAECSTPEHISMIFLLHGRCESDLNTCYRPNGLDAQARRMGLGGFLSEFPQLPEGQNLANARHGLAWLLKEEDLDITGDGDEELDLRNPLVAFTRGAAPRSAGQSTYFSWVPSIDKLTKGQGQIKDDCRHANKGCPLHARFLIQGGEVGACHVFHDDSNSPGVERDIRLFDYLIPGQRSIEQQAVADAVQVEFHEESNSVILESENLLGRPPLKVKALLSPDANGRLTLIVANLPECPTQANPKALSRHGCHHAHSDVLFRLLKNDQVLRPIRVINEERRRVADPGPCEEEMEQFEIPFASTCLLQYPHTITACDGTRFPKPTQ